MSGAGSAAASGGRRIVVDYEELSRMSRVWAGAADALARQALAVGALAVQPCFALDAVFDPLGAARAEASIVAAACVPHGLAALSARLAADALALDAVVTKERLVDDFPARQVEAFERWLVTAPVRFPVAPGQTLRTGLDDALAAAAAAVSYVAPYTEPLVETFALSPLFRADVASRHPISVDPVFGLPLALVGVVAPEGPGYVGASTFAPSWAGAAASSPGELMRRVADLEKAPAASLAIQEVRGADGVTRYVVELPGLRHLGVAADPLDLSGSIDAMVTDDTAYAHCVVEALDAAGVPRGADVLLVGHSEGGIVAADLADDPAFNGTRVTVTHVIAAGSPISSKLSAAHGTRVFSIENVNDVVTHLDGVDGGAGPQTAARLTYQFSDDEHGVGQSHAATLYAEHLDALDTSPNPLFRAFDASAARYFSGPTTTWVFTMHDAPPS